MSKDNSPQSGVKQLVYNYAAVVDVGSSGASVPIELKCGFIPDEISFDMCFLGEKASSSDLIISPVQKTVNTDASTQNLAYGMQMIVLYANDIIPISSGVCQCNLTNTYNPVRQYTNMSRAQFNGTFNVSAKYYSQNVSVIDGLIFLNIKFVRNRMAGDEVSI